MHLESCRRQVGADLFGQSLPASHRLRIGRPVPPFFGMARTLPPAALNTRKKGGTPDRNPGSRPLNAADA